MNGIKANNVTENEGYDQTVCSAYIATILYLMLLLLSFFAFLLFLYF